ncbi:hypothetical protein M408DRAFT_330118 [Serendipita vermifera MAFF 305830]|uniref:Uncharacterized protein n=1 Tax=Serendipita vermifera MAFF 305830 TaxID=933852 RepID=A0A0C2XDP1_SERVB|nr:hypothetical protein M408DRAFT_330118 [Serendipita vermifera MAFF 305830]
MDFHFFVKLGVLDKTLNAINNPLLISTAFIVKSFDERQGIFSDCFADLGISGKFANNITSAAANIGSIILNKLHER